MRPYWNGTYIGHDRVLALQLVKGHYVHLKSVAAFFSSFLSFFQVQTVFFHRASSFLSKLYESLHSRLRTLPLSREVFQVYALQHSRLSRPRIHQVSHVSSINSSSSTHQSFFSPHSPTHSRCNVTFSSEECFSRHTEDAFGRERSKEIACKLNGVCSDCGEHTYHRHNKEKHRYTVLSNSHNP